MTTFDSPTSSIGQDRRIDTDTATRSFQIGSNDFLLDGQPFRVLAGAIHYFRVHPDQWADRIRKARQMGLNTIETYIAWNAHAPQPLEFTLSGHLDLGRFLDLIATEGMLAIVRPGPYICAEWDNGGLPAWLSRDGSVGIRRNEPGFMAAVKNYFDHVLPVIERRQIQRGGPIIAVQIENEYGAYGGDKSYLQALVDLTLEAGIDVPLLTVDQPTDLAAGGLPGLHKTASFGSRSLDRLATLREHQPVGPLMCGEFWNGWFDHWGAHHHTTDVRVAAEELDDLLAVGASVNIYMFHGGTNFGFTSGANYKDTYQPTTTSYDYDAPLDEAGNPTPKYFAFRDVISKYAPVPGNRPRAAAAISPAFDTPLTGVVSLDQASNHVSGWINFDYLPTADDIGHFQGFTRYRTSITARTGSVLSFSDIRDRAQVLFNGSPVGVLSRENRERAISLPAGEGTLEILVEDQGRVNYGPRIGEPKGLIGPAFLDGAEVITWSVQPLKTDRIHEFYALSAPLSRSLTGPAFFTASFTLDEPADLFLSTEGWTKGVAWINGFNLGRYWSRGPQATLYVPGPVTRRGSNDVVLFEQHAGTRDCVKFVPQAILGHTGA